MSSKSLNPPFLTGHPVLGLGGGYSNEYVDPQPHIPTWSSIFALYTLRGTMVPQMREELNRAPATSAR